MKTELRVRQAALGMCIAGAALCISGCGTAPSANGGAVAPVLPMAKVSGTVYGGQQPVIEAVIQLYAVGNQQNGSAATPLISTVVKTDGRGSFNITGLWNCNDTATYGSDPLLYIVATGGNPGLAGGTVNGALALMSALGRCSTISTSTVLNINEVTTVASVYALAPFMTDIAHVGAADNAALARAFATVRTLVDLTAGNSPGPDAPPGAIVPVQTLYALADAMATCISSDGGKPCDAFFAVTQVPGGTHAVDTVGGMLQVVHAPSNNVAALFNLIGTQAPFEPVLGAAPGDWTISVRFTGGGLSGPSAVALDAQGNAWIANGSGTGITELSNQGQRLTGDTGYSGGGSIFGAQAIALDKSGNAWVANTLLSTVVKLTTSNGTIQQAESFSTDIDGPIAIASDSQNHIWVANFTGGSVVELTSAGQPMGAGPLTAGGTLQAPVGVAIDGSGNAWITDNGAGVVAKFDMNQNLLSGSGFSDQAMVAPVGIAMDQQGQAWIADSGLAAVSRLSASGVVAANFPVSGGGLSAPSAVAIDGGGTAWVTSGSGVALTQVLPGGSIGGAFGSLNAASGVAIDASGNVWVTNSGDDTITKFIGIAIPVVSPLAANVGP